MKKRNKETWCILSIFLGKRTNSKIWWKCRRTTSSSTNAICYGTDAGTVGVTHSIFALRVTGSTNN